MGLHKFEKTFRKELKKREISPAANSWEKLSSQLEKEDKKSQSYYWLTGIAASLTAAFLIFSFVFNNETITEEPAIVDAPSSVIEREQDENTIIKKETPALVNEEKDLRLNNVPAAKEQPQGTVNAPVQEIVVNNSQDLPKKLENVSAAEDLVRDEKLSAGLEEVIAEVNSKLENTGDLSETEIDALLYQAAAEISRNRNNKAYAGKIDAGSLLMDVEMELDQTFRDKVFDLLKEGYLKARTAVANRSF